MYILCNYETLGLEAESASKEDIFRRITEAYNDATDYSYVADDVYDETMVLLGSEDPAGLLKRLNNWKSDIQTRFLDELRLLFEETGVLPGEFPNPSQLSVDNVRTYAVRKAALELDDCWTCYGEHGCYLNVSGYPYFRCLPTKEDVEAIKAHPDQYFIVMVYTK